MKMEKKRFVKVYSHDPLVIRIVRQAVWVNLFMRVLMLGLSITLLTLGLQFLDIDMGRIFFLLLGAILFPILTYHVFMAIAGHFWFERVGDPDELKRQFERQRWTWYSLLPFAYTWRERRGISHYEINISDLPEKLEVKGNFVKAQKLVLLFVLGGGWLLSIPLQVFLYNLSLDWAIIQLLGSIFILVFGFLLTYEYQYKDKDLLDKAFLKVEKVGITLWNTFVPFHAMKEIEVDFPYIWVKNAHRKNRPELFYILMDGRRQEVDLSNFNIHPMELRYIIRSYWKLATDQWVEHPSRKIITDVMKG